MATERLGDSGEQSGDTLGSPLNFNAIFKMGADLSALVERPAILGAQTVSTQRSTEQSSRVSGGGGGGGGGQTRQQIAY